MAEDDGQVEKAAPWPRDLQSIVVDLDVLRRIQLTSDRKLVRAVRTATSKGEYAKLMQMRGYELITVKDVEINEHRPLDALLAVLDRGDGPDDQNIKMVFRPPGWPGSPQEKERQEVNNLFPPSTMITDLTTETLLGHLYIHRGRTSLRAPPVIRDLSKVPSGMRFYFNHPFWNLRGLGSLLQLRPNTLRELDLSNNALTDVGDDLSRFEHLTELRLEGNRLTSLDLHHMPRLTTLLLASNMLRVLPELLGMPALQKLDLGENLIGSRTSGEGIHDERGESPDGWEHLAHSPLPELKQLLLPNNSITWGQGAFNERVARLADKQSLTALDFRGNPFRFNPRLDDQPAIKRYREWILTQCPRLKVLDEEEVSDQERLRMLLEPITEPESADVAELAGGQPAQGASDGQRFPRFQYFGQPKLSALPIHGEMLASTFNLPSRLVINVLQRIQDSLQNLFLAPPQARFFFEPDGGFEALVATELQSAHKSGGALEKKAAAAAAADERPTGGAPFNPLDEANDRGPQGRVREERKRGRLDKEGQLKKGNDLLTKAQVAAEEEAFERYYLRTARGRRELGRDDHEATPIPVPPVPGHAADDAAVGAPASSEPVADGGDAAADGGDAGDDRLLLSEETRAKSAARGKTMPGGAELTHLGERHKRDGYQIIHEVVHNLVLIFDRAPVTDQQTTTGTERALAAEAAASAKHPMPPTTVRDERLSIAQRALRLLTTCAALGGDDHWGDVLARESMDALLQLLDASEEQEDLIITEALAVLVPPVLSPQCFDWVQWSHFEMLEALASVRPLVGLQLMSLAPTLQRVAVQELGTGPVPLYQLMGKLARYEDTFPRNKASRGFTDDGHGSIKDTTDPRSDSTAVHSPAYALHNAGVTSSVVSWIKADTQGKRTMDTWTPSRQICIWQIAEGLARHVPAAARQLVESKAALAVKNELLDHLGGGRSAAQWPRQKTQLVAQLIATVEAFCRHVAEARRTLYALPANFKHVLGDDQTPHYDDEQQALLLHVLPLLNAPAEGGDAKGGGGRKEWHLDAVLLTSVLQLLGSLVLTGNGHMLQALSKILFDKGMTMLRLALPSPLGVLDRIAARAAEWALATKVERGMATEDERRAYDELQRDFSQGGGSVGHVSIELVDDESVRAMLRALVRVMTAYAQRADDYTQALKRFQAREGPQPDDLLVVARTVSDLFDENDRDRIIFAMLNNPDDNLRIEAMKCLATVPTDNLEHDEIDHLVQFVHEKIRTHQMYVGRNEEMLMHAFSCFARVVRVPDAKEDPAAAKKAAVAVKGRRLGKTTGTLFREQNGDLVQRSLELLVGNTEREIPQTATAERQQKALLSAALTNFLQACSGPDSSYDADDADAPRVWPQAVSVLQMRDATNAMVEVMRNEERFGEQHQKLELEHSALADTIEPILHTLPQVEPSGFIKARLLNRLAELLEPKPVNGDMMASDGLYTDGEHESHAGAAADGAESADAKRKRVQGHVSFLRRNGTDLVLTQLENQLSEDRQIRRGERERAGLIGDDEGGADDEAPIEATTERSQRTAQEVLRFVALEQRRGELMMTAGDIKDEAAELDSAVEQHVDWEKMGIGALFSSKLHLMADLGDEGGRSGASNDEWVSGAGGVRRHTPRSLLSDPEAERRAAETQKNVEDSVAAAFRVLAACVRYGSPETKAGFLKRFAASQMQQDVLKLAGYAEVFSDRPQSEAALRFVTLWNAVLHAMDDESMINLDQLPLLDTLANMLPRMLAPLAARMGKSLDMWRRTQRRDGLAAANQELLNTYLTLDGGGYRRMLNSLYEIAGLYSKMLIAVEDLRFSSDSNLDDAAKELALRRLLPPSKDDATGGGDAQQTAGSALLAFLSTLFFDVVLRLAEGWHAGAGVASRNELDRLTRQDTVSAIKSLLASFCVIDEERRFELFQLTARLEARWSLTLPPALMSAIRAITAEELFKRALLPYLTKTAHVLEPEGEVIFDAAWVVQEAPRRMRSQMVMLMVTNRALYLLEPSSRTVCTVCEPWKLCPDGPRLKYRVPFYRIKKVVLDFTVKFGCGQRFKLICMQEAGAARSAPSAPADGSSGFLAFCQSCFAGGRPSGGGGGGKQGGDANGKAEAGGTLAKPTSRPRPATIELQFSTLHVGVVERLTRTIKRQMDPRPLDVVRDTHMLRALSMRTLEQGEELEVESPGSVHELVAIDPIERMLALPPVDPRFAVRCELAPEKGVRKAKPERLLVLTEGAITIFSEDPELFGTPLAEEEELGRVAPAERSTRSGRSGDAVLKYDTSIRLDDLEKLELEMCAEPRVHLEGQDEKGKKQVVLLQFADDTAALLFRMHMRNLLWDKGRAEWRAHTIAKAGD